MKKILLIMISMSLFMYAELSRDNSAIVDDSSTGLAWQDDYTDNGGKIKRATWQDAIIYCHELSLGGKNDWRLPNIRELKSIVDTTKSRPAMNSIFTNVNSTDFWSATTSMSDANNAWVVGFYRGGDYWASKTLKDYVRCVRGGL